MILQELEYTFIKGAAGVGTITFNGLGTIELAQILTIQNVKEGSQEDIFLAGETGLGGTLVNNVLTLEKDTSSMVNTDELQIILSVIDIADRYYLGGKYLKSVLNMPKVVTIPQLFEIGENEIPDNTPHTSQGYKTLLPKLIESDISELVTNVIPLPPPGGIAMTIVSTSAFDVRENLSTGTLSLTGVAGSLDTLTVNAINILSSIVPFNTDIDTTYSDIVDNINSFVSIPDYSGKKRVTITLTGVSGTADITMAGVTKTATFVTSLAVTAINFVSQNRLAYRNAGILLSTTGIGDIIFLQRNGSAFVTGNIVSVTANLSGTSVSLVEIKAAKGTGIAPNALVVAGAVTTLVPTYTPMAGGTAGGTGAHTVNVTYLLADGTLTNEDCYLNGITPVSINNGLPIYRVNTANVKDSGIGLVPVGNITIQDITPTVYKLITLGKTQDRTILRTIPLGMVGVVHYWDSGTVIGKESLFRLKANAFQEHKSLVPLPVGNYYTFDSAIAKNSMSMKELHMPLLFPELTDIKITVVDLGRGGGTGISTFQYYTEPKPI